MKKLWVPAFVVFLSLGVLLSACGGYNPAVLPTTDPYVLLQTVEAQQTLAALQTQISQPVVVQATATPTATSLPPTATPTATATAIQIRCDAAQYVSDVTIPDG